MLTENVSQSGKDTLLPQARKGNLVVRETPDELLVYDLNNHQAHCLNQSAALAWMHCDGKTTVADLTTILSQQLNTQVDEDVVWLALKQLGKARLLEGQVARPMEKSGLSRREVIRRLGGGCGDYTRGYVYHRADCGKCGDRWCARWCNLQAQWRQSQLP